MFQAAERGAGSVKSQVNSLAPDGALACGCVCEAVSPRRQMTLQNRALTSWEPLYHRTSRNKRKKQFEFRVKIVQLTSRGSNHMKHAKRRPKHSEAVMLWMTDLSRAAPRRGSWGRPPRHIETNHELTPELCQNLHRNPMVKPRIMNQHT